MRIIVVTGDRNWYAPDLAEEVLTRLLARYGPNLVIVHGVATGIDRSSAEACGDLGVEQEAHPARWEWDRRCRDRRCQLLFRARPK